MSSNYTWLAVFLLVMFLFVWLFVHGAKKVNEDESEQVNPSAQDSFPFVAVSAVLIVGGMLIWLFDRYFMIILKYITG